MTEETRTWHQFITDADQIDDPAELRKLIGTVARELHEAEETLRRAESRGEVMREQADRAASAIRAAAARRAAIQTKIISELQKMLPAATQQARKGKPALLRMILRATK